MMLKLLVAGGNLRLRLPEATGSTEDKLSQGKAIIFLIVVYLHSFSLFVSIIKHYGFICDNLFLIKQKRPCLHQISPPGNR